MRRRGSTLIEVLASLGLAVLILTVAYSAWWLINRSSRMQSSRIDARHQVQIGLLQLKANLQSAKYVFTNQGGGSTKSYTFGSHDYNVCAANQPPGNYDLLCAEPEGPDPNAVTWKIFGFYLVPAKDADNPTAMQIMETWATGVPQSAINLSADNSAVDLSKIAPVSQNLINAYVDPDTYRLSVVASNPSAYAPHSVILGFSFKLRPNDLTMSSSKYLQSEAFEMQVFPRNQ